MTTTEMKKVLEARRLLKAMSRSDPTMIRKLVHNNDTIAREAGIPAPELLAFLLDIETELQNERIMDGQETIG